MVADKLVLGIVLALAGAYIEGKFSEAANQRENRLQAYVAATRVHSDILMEQRKSLSETVNVVLQTLEEIDSKNRFEDDDQNKILSAIATLRFIATTFSGLPKLTDENGRTLDLSASIELLEIEVSFILNDLDIKNSAALSDEVDTRIVSLYVSALGDIQAFAQQDALKKFRAFEELPSL